MKILDKALRAGENKKFKKFKKTVELVNAYEPEMELLEDNELKDELAKYKQEHLGGKSLDDLLPAVFALTREASKRTLGMRHFDVQLIGGMVLHYGDIAEMKTGEGKTLTATLAVVLNTLSEKGVHVVTVNDYLAKRDAEWMSPLYEILGLSVGVIQGDEHDNNIRSDAYNCDITYGTNSEFGFDYLRDNLVYTNNDKVQRGQVYAIVDEVDNILIDEARTPLIISGKPETAASIYQQFAKLVKTMEVGERPKEIGSKIPLLNNTSFVADYDYEIDEQHKNAIVTERGVAKAEKYLGIDNLYLAENGNLVNHLIQALRAQAVFKRDVDYAVINNEVKIVDEFTGRILEGRRWSDGLHQAIEAKEGIRIQDENQTVATITYQNYFRRYEKLSGMTGTALTEATEFMKIYDLQVVEIPTNKPMIRIDQNDYIYKTKEDKFKAIEEEIIKRHKNGQPVLVGTISVETSEALSKRLRRKGLPVELLNAKPEYVAQEAEIIAQAGRVGAVTIATNMAGRGVDIKLGGDPDGLAARELRKRKIKPSDDNYATEHRNLSLIFRGNLLKEKTKVEERGGLFILGTERHESRRIDNQLRGRSGRQGDPGESRFFLSAEDDLVRLFAGDKMYNLMSRLPSSSDGKPKPISAGPITKQIETAQKKVEEQNYLSRKHTLEYDDVMNEQREVIYKFRNNILEENDMSIEFKKQLPGIINRLSSPYVSEVAEDWQLTNLTDTVNQIFTPSFEINKINPKSTSPEELNSLLLEEALEAYDEKEEELSPDVMRQVERNLLLHMIDERWLEHLADMDYLREGIHLRSFAETKPIIAYKNEGYKMFGELIESIWDDYSKVIYHMEIIEENELEESQNKNKSLSYSSSKTIPLSSSNTKTSTPTIGNDPNGNPISRNKPCYCGSGKKYKNCHGKK